MLSQITGNRKNTFFRSIGVTDVRSRVCGVFHNAGRIDDASENRRDFRQKQRRSEIHAQGCADYNR